MLKELVSSVLAVTQILLSSASVSPPETIAEPPSHIVHAAGIYEGLKSTNSLEALENAYEKGNRYIELDFNFTSDFKPVCIHDWNHLAFSGYDGTRPSEKEFMENNVYSMFTPMNLDSVTNFMTKHTDLYIITDVKDLNIYFSNYVSNRHSELMDRFIVQIYSENEYEYVRKMGFKNIIFSLYKLGWEEKIDTQNLVAFAQSNELFGYTFPYSLCDIDGYVDAMKKAGIPLFVHTVNDKTEQQKYFDMGISGIYTDNVTHN